MKKAKLVPSWSVNSSIQVGGIGEWGQTINKVMIHI